MPPEYLDSNPSAATYKPKDSDQVTSGLQCSPLQKEEKKSQNNNWAVESNEQIVTRTLLESERSAVVLGTLFDASVPRFTHLGNGGE